jgi:hypothetical protein
MSVLNLRFTKGAPATLAPGMVCRVPDLTGKKGTDMFLVGSFTDQHTSRWLLAETVEWAEAIPTYTLDWLNDMGVPAKAVS